MWGREESKISEHIMFIGKIVLEVCTWRDKQPNGNNKPKAYQHNLFIFHKMFLKVCGNYIMLHIRKVHWGIRWEYMQRNQIDKNLIRNTHRDRNPIGNLHTNSVTQYLSVMRELRRSAILSSSFYLRRPEELFQKRYNIMILCIILPVD